MSYNVSVIIPAYNAAKTIEQTLDSLLAQTHPHWEAIVVDDESPDNTIEIVEKYVALDTRITLIKQKNSGASAARNNALQVVRFNWILFLDSDDWISNNCLERMTTALKNNSGFEAVHCGWNTVNPDGTKGIDKFALPETDMFPSFVRTCAFVIHSCIVRTELVKSTGGFDFGYKVCNDWDFWQRLCRAGVRFTSLREVHAYYRMSANSLTKNVQVSLQTAQKLIAQGHSFDARVKNPLPEYKDGLDTGNLNHQKLYSFTWFAGLYIGQAQDPSSLFDYIDQDCTAHLDPGIIASYVFEAVCFSACMPANEWLEYWNSNKERITAFLVKLEEQSRSGGLVKSTRVIIQGLILQNQPLNTPLIIGTTQGTAIEVTEPIAAIRLSNKIERLVIKVLLEGKPLGVIELPVFDLLVPGWLIKDNIAVKFAWQILQRYFEQTVYYEALIEIADEYEYKTKSDSLHNQEGWTTFLRQLWGESEMEPQDFYDNSMYSERRNNVKENPQQLLIELSEELPDIVSVRKKLSALITLGGANVGQVVLPLLNKKMTAHALRVEVTKAAGFELCILCVREIIIGKAFNKTQSIRGQLQQLAAERKREDHSFIQELIPEHVNELKTDINALVIGRRAGRIGLSGSRPAALPSTLASAIKEMIKGNGEELLLAPPPDSSVSHIFYAPQQVTGLQPLEEENGTGKKFSLAFLKRRLGNRTTEKAIEANRFAILRYGSIVTNETAGTHSPCVSRQLFQEHLQYLRANDYCSVGLNAGLESLVSRSPIPGKPVALAFENGFEDFYTLVWPLLKEYDFSATVFLLTGDTGKQDVWSPLIQKNTSFMNWEQIIELKHKGIEFGSNSLNYTSLSALSPTEIVQQALASRTIIHKNLGKEVKSISYPYGDYDPVISHLIGACGYTFALTATEGLCTFESKPLSLPVVTMTNKYTVEKLSRIFM